ncbi:pulmonary surfactant-associated protein C-like isoform X2 [Pseudophryne corroboree]|uniref:pulmonary surfactant-associated protein C-like isoform X2 n=1 Tax=Pseudophryne corroboree TaxID=495146 RepID=UPI0030813747
MALSLCGKPRRDQAIGVAMGSQLQKRQVYWPYSRFPKPSENGKKWIMGIALGLLLALIIIGATLIGVYMTQKHTEMMVTMAFESQDGESSQQTVSVDERENVAVIFLSTEKNSATVLLDYTRNIIGIRMSNSSQCYVLRMNEFRTPSIRDILGRIKNFQANNIPVDDKITYSFISDEEAKPAALGINVNILCSDVAIYWAKTVNLNYGKRRQDKVVIIIIT